MRLRQLWEWRVEPWCSGVLFGTCRTRAEALRRAQAMADQSLVPTVITIERAA
jgi:hypothetical protein